MAVISEQRNSTSWLNTTGLLSAVYTCSFVMCLPVTSLTVSIGVSINIKPHPLPILHIISTECSIVLHSMNVIKHYVTIQDNTH